MTDAENEIHNLITGAINTLRQDFRERADNLEKKVESLRPCIVTRQSCDERHRDIDKRMVDKTYFAGGVAVLLFVIAVVGVILAVMRF